MERDRPLPARGETARNALREALQAGEKLTARELSQQLRISERDVLDHLQHIERSLQRGSERLRIEPARCIACNFSFDERTRFAKPGRCPECKSTRIAPPHFEIM